MKKNYIGKARGDSAQYKKEFVNIMERIDNGRGMSRIFADFLFFISTAIQNAVNYRQDLEDKYLAKVKEYTPDEMNGFAEMHACVVNGLDVEISDFLGDVYMMAGLGSSSLGQFFTPYSLCRTVAEMKLTNLPKVPDRIIIIDEPACGGGAMILACAQVMREKDFDYTNWAYFHLTDLSEYSFMMAYIQCSLLGLSAKVQRGDTLTQEIYDTYYTPMYYATFMESRLRLQRNRSTDNEMAVPDQASSECKECEQVISLPKINKDGQMFLEW